MNRGYIKLWRKSLDSTVFAHDGMWKLWCLCLLKADHKEADVTIPGILEPIKLKPGQFITGRDSLHYDYHQGHLKKNYSRKASPTAITLYRWLLTLQKGHFLHIKSYNKFSIITICNWSQYQQSEQQVNNRRTTDEHKQELNKNNKEKYMSIPFKEIQLKYHEILPELPGIRQWTEPRKKAFAARWNSGIKNHDGTPIDSLEYWTELFQYIRNSQHMMGNNNLDWKASIDFIIKESSFTKIIEGQYHG